MRRSNDQSAGLDFVVRRYQQSNFDSQRSYFEEGFHPREQIDRFRKGVTSKDDLWQAIRLRQEFEPTWVEKSAGQAGSAINSPLAQVLMHAMVEAAGAAMSQSARRSVERRSQMGRGGTGRRIDVPAPRFERTATGRCSASRPRIHDRSRILSRASMSNTSRGSERRRTTAIGVLTLPSGVMMPRCPLLRARHDV